ncbi:CBS domain-containing protein [Stygiolobus caldivivus]|uniref:CBS domain-containing protein n=1 Tax=Stygiolobus caldivivus TaxID=2824673 RepID=A0A8D5U5Y4_9CREN|nr:CBS domain-containing protein [Stygiolobus caldivivus]BCU69867.1 CBS domain-containing protein [Stygiolobus caldivivus]
MIVGQLVGEKELVSLSHSSSIREVAKVMEENAVSSVVLKEDDKIVGIVTEKDIVKAVSKGLSYDYPAYEIASKNIIKIDYHKSVYDAYDMMMRNNIRHLVVEKDGKCVGVLSIRELSKALSLMLAESMSY